MRLALAIIFDSVLLAQAQWSSGAVGDYSLWPYNTIAITVPGGYQTSATLNSSSKKANQCGYLATAGNATKTLQNIHFMPGAVTKAGGTDLRVGIQGVSATTGPPIQPDGTWAAGNTAFATIADASITANTWLRSGTVAGSLSMTGGSLYCMVVEPENYAGSDSFVIRGTFTRFGMFGQGGSYDGSAWVGASSLVHLLEFTDGTYGYIGISIPLNSINQVISLNTGSTPDEVALKVSPSTSMNVAGICADNNYSTSSGDLDYVLYNGTTAMISASVDAQQFLSTSASQLSCALFPTVQSLTSGNTYYAAVKPTTANNVRVVYNGVDNSAYWSVWGGGTASSYSSRTDAGAWSDTTTRRPSIWLLLSGSTSTGSSSSGAYVVAQ